MRGFYQLAVAAATTLISQTLAIPLVVSPGDAKSLVITKENTLNGTHVPKQKNTGDGGLNAAGNPLTISLSNNYGGELYAYVTGKDPSDAIVMLSNSGEWYYPDPAGSAEPIAIDADVALKIGGQGEKTDLTVPDFITSGRVWVSEGPLTFFTVADGDGLPQLVQPSAANPEDPSANVNWGFVELTNTADAGIWANISFVDFVGMILGMGLTLGSGEHQEVQGLAGNAVPEICSELEAQSAIDGQPWGEMCVKNAEGQPLRIMAPNMYVASNPGAQDGYYDEYIEQVWAKYANEDLTINTQMDAGEVKCRVNGDNLECDGDNRPYPKPTVLDIWGCNSGPFEIIKGSDNPVHEAIVPRLCAAFHRTTLLMDGRNVQPALPSDSYYTNDPTSHYSRLVHKYEVDNRGYAFSYDDVNPDNENAAGVVSGPDPQVLEVIIGGFASNSSAAATPRRRAQKTRLTKLSVAA